MAECYESLWGAANKELRWLLDVPDHMWSSLASAAGCRADVLKDKTLQAAHVAYHFLWRRVLEPAGQMPWKWCRGDLKENLEVLGSMEAPPEEPCSRHLWHLIQEDEIPEIHLIGVLKLLAQCPWSTLPAEQQHGSLSLLHRWHPEFSLRSLLSRSLLHQAVRLLPSESKLDKRVSQVLRKVAKLDRADPSKTTGSHMLVQALCKVVSDRKDRRSLNINIACFSSSECNAF